MCVCVCVCVYIYRERGERERERERETERGRKRERERERKREKECSTLRKRRAQPARISAMVSKMSWADPQNCEKNSLFTHKYQDCESFVQSASVLCRELEVSLV